MAINLVNLVSELYFLILRVKKDGTMKKILILLMFLSTNVFAEPVDINRAGAQELAASLDGVGAKKAEDIVKYRQQHGIFRSADELVNVKGIGKKTIAKNKENIRLTAGVAVTKEQLKAIESAKVKNKPLIKSSVAAKK